MLTRLSLRLEKRACARSVKLKSAKLKPDAIPILILTPNPRPDFSAVPPLRGDDHPPLAEIGLTAGAGRIAKGACNALSNRHLLTRYESKTSWNSTILTNLHDQVGIPRRPTLAVRRGFQGSIQARSKRSVGAAPERSVRRRRSARISFLGGRRDLAKILRSLHVSSFHFARASFHFEACRMSTVLVKRRGSSLRARVFR